MTIDWNGTDSTSDLNKESGSRAHRLIQGPIRVEYQPLSALQRAPKNPKAHALDVLRQSMSRFRYTEPVIVDERTGRLLSGHGRLEELERAKAAGEPAPDRIVVKGDEWFVPVVRGIATQNDDEAAAYLIADNQSVIARGWIDPILAEVLLQTTGREPELGPFSKPDRRHQNDVWHISQAQATVDLRTVAVERTGLKHDGRTAHMVKEHPAPFPVDGSSRAASLTRVRGGRHAACD